MVCELELTPATIVSMNQAKFDRLCQAGLHEQFMECLEDHLEGDPGDGFPAMTNSLNTIRGSDVFVSCFCLSNGKRVTMRSRFNPNGTIARLIVHLP